MNWTGAVTGKPAHSGRFHPVKQHNINGNQSVLPLRFHRDLGPLQTPPKQALADAVELFRANGYVKK